MAKRLSILMGLAILAVAVSHAAFWGQYATPDWARGHGSAAVIDGLATRSFAYFLFFAARQTAAFAVPAFLFISGYFVAFSASGSRGFGWAAVRTRMAVLVTPYLIWSVVIFAGHALVGRTYPPLTYVARFLTQGATGPYYYVPLLCYFYLLSPLLIAIARRRPFLLLAGSAVLQLSVIVASYLDLFAPQNAAAGLLMRLAPGCSPLRWSLYFVAGMVFRLQWSRLKGYVARFSGILPAAALVFWGIALVERELIYRSAGAEWGTVPIGLASTLYAAGFLICFITCERLPAPFDRLTRLNNKAYGIYLLHETCMSLAAGALYRFLPQLAPLHLLVAPVLLVLGLAAPLAFMHLVAHSPAQRAYRLLFG